MNDLKSYPSIQTYKDVDKQKKGYNLWKTNRKQQQILFLNLSLGMALGYS